VVDGATGRTLPVYPTLRLGYLPPGHLGESDCIPELPQPTAQSADLAGCTFRFSEDPGLPGLAVSYTTAPLPDYGDIAWDPPTGTTLNGQPATLRVGRIPAKPGGRPQYERWLTWTSRGIYYTVRTMVDGSPNTLLPAAELVKIGQSLR
jgi:hypothetical protein